MKTFIALTVALLIAVPCVLAAEPNVDTAGAARAHAEAIAPFVDLLTVAVIRIDMAKIDPDAAIRQIEEWQKIALKDPKELRQAATDMKKELQEPRKLPQAFREAGGKDLYIVFTLAAVPMGSPMFYVAPIGPGGNAEALAEAIRQWDGPKPSAATQKGAGQSKPGIETVQMHGAVVVGDAMTFKRLQVLEPSEQPQLQAAFEATEGAGVQILAVPSPDVRAVLAAMLPMADSERTERVREPIQTMIRSLQWAAIGIDLPPQTRVRLVVQADDAQGAQAVHAALKKVFALGLEKAAIEAPEQKQVVRQIEQIVVPEPKGSQLVQTIGSEQIGQLVTLMGPGLMQARGHAKKAFSMNNMAMFGRAIHIYADTYKNQWPESLREMVEKAMHMPYDESMDLLANPQRPKFRPAYIYVKPSLPMSKIANPGEVVVLYERYDDWGDGINVLFLDGHVTFIGEQTEFEKMLGRTRTLDPGAVTVEAPATQKTEAK